ncbi:MAG: XTP/dITP diphosphatase [Nitrososphaerota archaeon]
MSFHEKTLIFATSNRSKFLEAKAVLAKYGIELGMKRIKTVEVKSDDLRSIVVYSAQDAWEKVKRPLLVEDAGLFVHTLSGFPGPYSSYVYRTIGIAGILKLMEGRRDRRAFFSSALAYVESKGLMKVFLGKAEGEISHEPRGEGGFGFDPIFIPKGKDRTFAEMSLEEKNVYSHRAKALEKFAKWYRRG